MLSRRSSPYEGHIWPNCGVEASDLSRRSSSPSRWPAYALCGRSGDPLAGDGWDEAPCVLSASRRQLMTDHGVNFPATNQDVRGTCANHNGACRPDVVRLGEMEDWCCIAPVKCSLGLLPVISPGNGEYAKQDKLSTKSRAAQRDHDPISLY